MGGYIETAGQHAYRQIRERILSGDLAPGHRLNQQELAHDLGMSRIPVRDALRLLAVDGLVELRAHTTATVTPLSVDDLQELYELRDAIEPMLCRFAVPSLDEGDIDAMASDIAAMGVSAGPDEWQSANHSFHARLYGRSGRPSMIEIVDRARHQMDRYTRLHLEEHKESAAIEHELILDAARRHQVGRLEAAVRAHIAAGYAMTLRLLEDGTLAVPGPAGARLVAVAGD